LNRTPQKIYELKPQISGNIRKIAKDFLVESGAHYLFSIFPHLKRYTSKNNISE